MKGIRARVEGTSSDGGAERPGRDTGEDSNMNITIMTTH